MSMKKRRIATFEVAPIGLGCMSMSHAYGIPDQASAEKTLHHALDIGYNFLDTAALYGFGANEKLLGNVIKARRNEYVLASKCGLIRGPDGKRSVNGRPEIIQQTCEQSLKNLQTEVIDLYYLHRADPTVALEDQIGTLADLVKAGKIRAIGMSEVSSSTIKKAAAIHPIAAVQSEYSLWTRNPENQVLDTCKKLGISFVAFSPLGRGFLADAISANTQLAEKDIRLSMPRFLGNNLIDNLNLLTPLRKLAAEKQCTCAQLALAWLLAKDDNIIPIPGTQIAAHAEENFHSQAVSLSPQEMQLLEECISEQTVKGERYNEATLATMET